MSSSATSARAWRAGTAPVAVVMISLNEGRNLPGVLENLQGWAQEVFLVDSFSSDETVDIALAHGVHVVQRRFGGFGDQWNFALRELPISAPWTMKLDPDERLTDALKRNIVAALADPGVTGLSFDRRLWFMTRPLPVKQPILRVWRTGHGRFTDVAVNEHPVVDGPIRHVAGDLEHHDSPDLEHWLDKQNRYTTSEALMAFRGEALADKPRLFGTPLQRRMWMKEYYIHVPGRYVAMFLYHYLVLGAFRAGWVGMVWSRLRSDVYRLREYKLREMHIAGRASQPRRQAPAVPHPGAGQSSPLSPSRTTPWKP